MCGHLGNAAFSHAELVSPSRSKNRSALKNEDPLIAKGRDPDQEHCQDDVNGEPGPKCPSLSSRSAPVRDLSQRNAVR